MPRSAPREATGVATRVRLAQQHGTSQSGSESPSTTMPRRRRAVESFIQDPAVDWEPTFKQSYAHQSGEVFGFLEQMKESFESNLLHLRREAESQKAYEGLKAAKESGARVENAGTVEACPDCRTTIQPGQVARG